MKAAKTHKQGLEAAKTHKQGMETSTEYGVLQTLVNTLYRDRKTVSRLDVLILAENSDLIPDLLEIVNLLPPGVYHRQALCDQINSSLSGHGWGYKYGTVE
ncbi:MAG: hypothetical protein FWD43_03845 [Coriobacteriia bacterium]|nr:hypothetical protein [Coriobacteriia bacterium]